MELQLKQINLDDWPELLNDEVVELSLVPTDISRRRGIKFGTSEDSLDIFEGAVVIIEGRMVGLLSYPRGPVLGTTIVVEEGTFDVDLGVDQIKPILDALGVSREEVTWVRHVPTPRYFTR